LTKNGPYKCFDVLILPFSAWNIQLNDLFYTHMYTTGGGYVEANYMHNNISIICTQAWLQQYDTIFLIVGSQARADTNEHFVSIEHHFSTVF
jgi:hypothetical protein